MSAFDVLCQAVESVSTFDGSLAPVLILADLCQAVESVSTFDVCVRQ